MLLRQLGDLSFILVDQIFHLILKLSGFVFQKPLKLFHLIRRVALQAHNPIIQVFDDLLQLLDLPELIHIILIISIL